MLANQYLSPREKGSPLDLYLPSFDSGKRCLQELEVKRPPCFGYLSSMAQRTLFKCLALYLFHHQHLIKGELFTCVIRLFSPSRFCILHLVFFFLSVVCLVFPQTYFTLCKICSTSSRQSFFSMNLCR